MLQAHHRLSIMLFQGHKKIHIFAVYKFYKIFFFFKEKLNKSLVARGQFSVVNFFSNNVKDLESFKPFESK